MKKFFLLLFVLFLPLYFYAKDFNTYSNTSPHDFKAFTGFEKLFGYTLYGVGVNESGAFYMISQLKFPLDTYLLKIGFEYIYSETYQINFVIKRNFIPYAGKMEDSDWGYWYMQGYPWAYFDTLDIFSTSDASLSYFFLGADFIYRIKIFSPFIFGFGLSFFSELFYYEISNVDQYYPSYNLYKDYLDPATYSGHIIVSGKVMTYELRRFLPYINIFAKYNMDNMDFQLKGYFSPFSFSFDRDDHILRSKEAISSSSGFSFLIDFAFSYYFTKNLFASLTSTFFYVQEYGTQTQYRYKETEEGSIGRIGSIDYVSQGLEYSFGFNFGYHF